MKTVIFLGVLLTTLGCTSTTRYTQQSPEIDLVKSGISNYVNGEWEDYSSNYADGASIFFNVTEESPATIQETIASQKLSVEPFSTYAFDREKDEYEMVVTDKGETWVNFWGTWKGTLAATGEEFVIPVHLTYQFVDGKIVKAFGYWNNAEIQMTLTELAKEAEEIAANQTSD
ncbi:nuclear transport factor 2 family protein [Algoriphagus sp.]|uniref:nuclear transport factor 2 family protein n=1 Tax=Algoriphagus sp. TaxID=1872435 RepID=UPI00327B801E